MKLSILLPFLPLLSLSTGSPGSPTYTPTLTPPSLAPAQFYSPKAGSTAAYVNGTIETVAQLASELVSVQIVGFAEEQSQLQFLCDSFSLTRLAQQFYNVTLVREIICAGAAAGKKGGNGVVNGLEPLSLIRNLSTLVSTQIWIVQAIGAVQGVSFFLFLLYFRYCLDHTSAEYRKQNVDLLCKIIDPVAAAKIGLSGDLVKTNVCAAAKVANAVKKSGRTQAVTLNSPQVTDIAPLDKLTLSFERVSSNSSKTAV